MSRRNPQSAPTNRLLLDSLRELKEVSDYTAEKEAEMQKLSVEFKDMSYLGLLWDSKVPEKDKEFYYFSRLTSSDRDDVLEEIKKYQDFYKEFRNAIHEVTDITNQTENEITYPREIDEKILDLNKKLSEMAEAAKYGKKATSSSAVYDLHRSFIERHEKLENLIKRVECVALKKGLKKATDGWQESIRIISSLQYESRNTQEKYDQLCNKFDRLFQQNEQILERNQKMEKQLANLMQENASTRNRKTND